MSQKNDNLVFKLSMISLLVFAILGIVFGIILNSDVIFIDGVYSIISILASFLTMKITQFISKKDIKRFPFGKERLEPLVVLLQYTFLNLVLLYVFIDAIKIILNGGSELQLGWTLVYLVATTVVLYFFIVKLRQYGSKTKSPIVKTELINWEISLVQSLYVIGGYLIGLLIQMFTDLRVILFIDPIILIVFVLVTFNQTISESIDAFKELIGMNTLSSKQLNQFEEILKSTKENYEIKSYYLRLNKVGKQIVLEVDFLVDDHFKYQTIAQQDQIREFIFEKAKSEKYDLWLNVTFTNDMRWID